MALTIADIGTQLLMDSTDSLQEIEARITARVFGAVHHPERGPTVRKVLEELLAVPAARQPPARTVNPAARDSRVGRVTARLVAPLLLPSPPIRGITNTEGSQTMTQDTKATHLCPQIPAGPDRGHPWSHLRRGQGAERSGPGGGRTRPVGLAGPRPSLHAEHGPAGRTRVTCPPKRAPAT